MKKFISWRRVSTKRQGRSNLGLSAQLDIVQFWAKEEGGEIVADYMEVFTGTDLAGCKELQKAIAHCKEIGATLIIAKTDRFRDDAEAIKIYNEMGKNIYFCDCPSQDEFMIKLMFLLASREAKTISIRTKQGLGVIKKKTDRGETHISKAGNVITSLGRPKGCAASQNAIDASVSARKDKAKANPHNQRFCQYLRLYEKKNGVVRTTAEVCALIQDLATLGYKTAKGLDFDISRCRAMIKKVKTLYAI